MFLLEFKDDRNRLPVSLHVLLYNIAGLALKMQTMDNELTVVGYVSDHKMITASCRHFLCNNMIDNKEEVPIEEAYLFSLAPSDPNSPKPTLTCSFAPIECRKTYKLLRTLPTYHPDLDQPFQSEATLHIRSMRELSERKETPSPIMVPKPVHRFCQVCKESFDDYLKHTTHPLHQRRLKESDQSFSLDSLKEILEAKRRKGRKITWFRENQSNNSEREEETGSVTSLECSQLKSQGSKKRIVLRQGELEPVSVQSATKCEEEDPFEMPPPVQRRVHRKFSNFRQLVED